MNRPSTFVIEEAGFYRLRNGKVARVWAVIRRTAYGEARYPYRQLANPKQLGIPYKWDTQTGEQMVNYPDHDIVSKL